VRRWGLLAALLAALLALTASVPTAQGQPTYTEAEANDVAGKLMCECGAAVTVADCGENAVANGMRAIISQQVALGKTTDEILDHFVSLYGECILAEPRKSGIGLAAWLAPFVAIVAGGAVLGGSMWAWSRRGRQGRAVLGGRPPEQSPSNGGEQMDEYERRVEEELKKFE
jgi:cytochrome c-type biogenesis protein CcmH